jgi:hypothetical protein
MDERRVIELTPDELAKHRLMSGKMLGGRWELGMPLEGGIGITYVSEPGESFDKARAS